MQNRKKQKTVLLSKVKKQLALEKRNCCFREIANSNEFKLIRLYPPGI